MHLRCPGYLVDDMEMHSRRWNLLFCGVQDTERESWEVSEGKVVRFASEKIGITLSSSEIGWAHRLGAYRVNSTRPIIVKFQSYKAKIIYFCLGLC